MRKSFLVLILVLFTTLLNSCCWYAPWRSEEYINIEIPSIIIGTRGNESLPDKHRYNKFYVNDSFISVGITAHNRTTTSGNSPFCIAIGAHGKKNIHKYAVIKSINLKSNLDKQHKIFDQINFPLKIDFEPFQNNITLAYFSTDYDLYLDFDKNEEITVFLDVEVSTKRKTERKKIEYHFVPHLRSGTFQCIRV